MDINYNAEVVTAKRVQTKDEKGHNNGFLMELQKYGKKTTAYLTSCDPGAKKGYHLHRVRDANYVCISGKINIDLFFMRNGEIEHITRVLQAGDKLHIPAYVATALINDGVEPARIINFPNPAYDPDLQDEQVEFTKKDCKEGKLKAFLLRESK